VALRARRLADRAGRNARELRPWAASVEGWRGARGLGVSRTKVPVRPGADQCRPNPPALPRGLRAFSHLLRAEILLTCCIFPPDWRSVRVRDVRLGDPTGGTEAPCRTGFMLTVNASKGGTAHSVMATPTVMAGPRDWL
jgi:hypothetical protein